MNAIIRKWGNSLAIRIPKSIAEEIQIDEGSEVNLKLIENKLVISSKKKKKYNLKDLVSKITKENRHGEISVGPRVGRELL
ncbi:MAG: AbrB/MazE/SpoVT family DNA-binding domain-containing protein [Ignavibacteriae bacterium]|nr:MAG: AbrB/MazE/SpoVT family DNA-binding domain-containing protein [Ignavibacteriota bacterium]